MTAALILAGLSRVRYATGAMMYFAQGIPQGRLNAFMSFGQAIGWPTTSAVSGVMLVSRGRIRLPEVAAQHCVSPHWQHDCGG